AVLLGTGAVAAGPRQLLAKRHARPLAGGAVQYRPGRGLAEPLGVPTVRRSEPSPMGLRRRAVEPGPCLPGLLRRPAARPRPDALAACRYRRPGGPGADCPEPHLYAHGQR